MAVKNYDNLQGTGFYDDDVCFTVSEVKISNKKRKVIEPPEKHFLEKIKDEEWDDMKSYDYKQYFEHKAESYGYKLTGASKGVCINEGKLLKRLMKEYRPQEIISLIDFMWDIFEDPKVNKTGLRLFILTTYWGQIIINSWQDWKAGKYKKDDKPVREWREPENKNIKKSKVTFGRAK